MILLETSYLVDYGKGRESARSFYDNHEYESVAASTFSMFELAYGIVWDGTGELDTLQVSLMWVEFLPFTIPDAIEAARVNAELQSAGTRIPIGDTVIAGVARNRGATLVTSDEHFERIEGVETISHRA